MAKLRRLILLCLIFTLTASVSAQWTDLSAATQHTEPLEIQVHFPAIPFDGPLSADVSAQLERTIAQTVQDLVAELLPYGSVFGSYEIHYDAAPLLSLTLTYSGYRRGMAHPMHLAQSLTFDLRTGQRLTLEDLFVGDYLAAMSQHIAAQITADGLPLLRPFDGIDSSADFHLTREGVVIYFQLYDLVPYAWGFPQFLIPYVEMAEFIDAPYREALLGENVRDEP